MSDNKFIKRLKGEQTAKSILEIKNESAKTSFANMPQGTSNAIDVFSDHRGNATAVLNGTTNWKVSNSDLLLADTVSGDGQDFTSTYTVIGTGLWVNASYTFPSTGDPRHPIAMVFNPSTKWVLKVCGDSLIVDGGSTVDFTMLVKIGTSNVYSKNFTIRESAGQFSKEFIIDFGEANSNIVKASGLSTLTVQLLCGTANASARIYNGMTVLTCLQRKVDASAVSNSSANVEDVLDGNIIPSDYFSNPEFIDQVEDGEDAYAVFTRDGDDVNFSGWTPKEEIATKSELTAHIDDKNNPHEVTKTQVGLGNVDNTSDLNKPISTATQTALNAIQTQIDGKQPKSASAYNMGNTSGGWTAMSTSQQDALNSGATTTNITQIGTNTTTIGNHIANTNNPHNVTATQVGLGNVDNTSDADKPISTATQDALDLKANIADLGTAAYTDSTDYATSAQGGKADTAVQPGDNVSDLNNDAGYQTAGDVATAISGKQDTLTAGANITITGTTISATDTTYSDFTGASAGDAGTHGLVPAPAAGDQAKFLQGDGTWANPTAATAWGNITGALSDQTDLQNALDAKANTDLDNLTSVGQNISNWSSNVTNCITNIPQDIKLELNNGTLTLKAGSKVCVPNGFEADGVTPKFDVVTIASDLTIDGGSGGFSGAGTLYYGSNSALVWYASGVDASGTTPPSTSNFYNTSTNTVYRYNRNVQGLGLSFPLAHITVTSDVIKSIDQVFNGFGYIGSTIFALPGVKGLIPDGRNSDGTLKNTEWTCSNVITRTFGTETRDAELGFDGSYFSRLILSQRSTYDRFANVNLNLTDNPPSIWGYTPLATCTLTAGVISNFNIKTVFHAVDYNDTEYIAHQSSPSRRSINITAPASGNSIVAPADGYFQVDGTSTGAGQRLNCDNGGRTGFYLWSQASGQGLRATVPVSKGDSMYIGYTIGNVSIKFTYANGAR